MNRLFFSQTLFLFSVLFISSELCAKITDDHETDQAPTPRKPLREIGPNAEYKKEMAAKKASLKADDDLKKAERHYSELRTRLDKQAYLPILERAREHAQVMEEKFLALCAPVKKNKN